MGARYEDVVSIGPKALAGRYLRRFWQPVALAQSLKPKRPFPIRILGEDFTLYRGETGTAHLVAPQCPHRGLSLSVGRVIGDSIECFYHGWTFAADGHCTAQPAEDAQFKKGVCIATYPVHEALGLVFAYLGEGDPPDFPMLNVFEQGRIENRASYRPWPFFVQIENSVDETHFNFVHRRTKFDDIGMNKDMPVLTCEKTVYGMRRIAQRGETVREGHFFMPNWSLSSKYEHDEGWSDHVVWRVPVEDDAHISFTCEIFYQNENEWAAYKKAKEAKRAKRQSMPAALDLIKEIIAGRMHIDDLPADHPDIILIQDGVACLAQPFRKDRTSEYLGASDRQVMMVRRLWNAELKALDEGKYLTAWHVPHDLKTSRGI